MALQKISNRTSKPFKAAKKPAAKKEEAEAEATQEILDIESKNDIDLEKFDKEKKVEDELAKLKQRLKK